MKPSKRFNTLKDFANRSPLFITLIYARNSGSESWEACCLALLTSVALASAQQSDPMRMEVDARDISRKLLHVREEIPAKPGHLALWYPKWIPGTHAPGGPIQNVGGLTLETPEGTRIGWRRDEADVCRIECTVPEGADRVILHLDYICNQATVSSDGVDSFGDAQLCIINWNTCLLYPETASIDQLGVGTRLLLPKKWRWASALRSTKQNDDEVEFSTETLRDLVDSPLIAGEFLRTIELKPKDFPPTFMHLVSESAEGTQLEDNIVQKYQNVAIEAGALFGGTHFSEYHFLVTCSDQAGHTGVEHLSSSLNGVSERDLIDDKKRKGWVAELIPHEFVHSWCGKHRRPAGMVTQNFHTPERTSLLWVYEGLTEYLGHVLMVRSGLVSTNEFREELAQFIDELRHTEGRRWRALEDTAIANHILRATSPNWNTLRRSQDYYLEGELLWLEADTLIREQTDGHHSLNDFCKKFMGPEHKEKIVPYERADLVEALNEVAKYDWETFIHERVDVPQTALSLSVVERCGYRLQYATKPSEVLKDMESNYHFVSAVDSLGVDFNDRGQIRNVVPGMPGDKAGLAPGMTVEGVNGRKFGPDRLRDAVADSVTKGQVDFLVLEGDSFRTIKVEYSDGLKYLELVRDPSKPDLLSAILKPLACEGAPLAKK